MDANTMEGRALISNAEKLTGLNLNPRNIVFGAIPIYGMNTEPDTYPIIYSPKGYTICSAAPSYINTTRLNPEAAFMGIATPGDTNFSSTIRRVRKDRSLNEDGLAMELNVPCVNDTHIQAGFDVVFVKPTPGWRQKYKACLPTGSHPWLSRKNQTSLKVKCDSELEYCE